MHRTRKWMVTLVIVVTGGCSGIEVKQDYNAAADFPGLDTYAWVPAASNESGETVENSALIDQRIRTAVDSTLAAQGYRKVPPAKADFHVGYHCQVRQPTGENGDSRTRVGVGMGGGSRGTFGGVGISIGLGGGDRRGDESALTIDILEPGGKQLIWRGMAKQRLVWENDPRKTTERIRKTVAAILAKFPPE